MQTRIQNVTRVALMLAVITVAQQLGFHQLVTGSIVNATLIVATYTLGIKLAAVICLLSPLLAFVQGKLAFAPMVIFIGLGNFALCWLVGQAQDRPRVFYFLTLAAAAVVKPAILAASAYYVVRLPYAAAIGAMGLNQVFTAIIGGLVALPILFGYLQRQTLAN